MSFVARRLAALSTAIILFAASEGSALAQKKYDTGVTDTEIKIGNIMPYSGPASAYGVIGRTEAAYFRKINAKGGITGRKIIFISYDDAYSPPKAVEHKAGTAASPIGGAGGHAGHAPAAHAPLEASQKPAYGRGPAGRLTKKGT